MNYGSLYLHVGGITSINENAIKKCIKANLLANIMSRKPGVYTSKPALRKLIGNRLGWVDSASLMKKKIPEIESFGKSVISSGIRHVLLMGMGGSSLCPELFKFMFGKHPRLKSFNVIDSTDPAAVSAAFRKIEIKKTLFIVASKSGGTLETRSHEAFFIEKLKQAGVKSFGRHFIAITDKGSNLEKFARRNRYRKIFVNPSDIGGRYSSLSYFGMVPAFFAGVDLKSMLEDALSLQELLKSRSGEANPGLALGALMFSAAIAGRDKLTFAATPKCAPFIPWVEQLVAESTGKNKKGIVPIENESTVSADKYGNDRLMVFFSMSGEKNSKHTRLTANFKRRRIPYVEIIMGSKAELGRQFLLWEAATAVTGYLMNINPFDEPNVTESKNNTNAILDNFVSSSKFPYEMELADWSGLSLHAIGGSKTFSERLILDPKKFLKQFFRSACPPKYMAFLNYYRSDKQSEKTLDKLRDVVRTRTKMATLRGYGPRFLHSIGQLYKGGPRDGMFVIFMRNKYGKLEIPGKPFTFGQLITAQGLGDAQGLMKRKLPTLLIKFDGSPSSAVQKFTRLVQRTLK